MVDFPLIDQERPIGKEVFGESDPLHKHSGLPFKLPNIFDLLHKPSDTARMRDDTVGLLERKNSETLFLRQAEEQRTRIVVRCGLGRVYDGCDVRPI